MTWPSYKSPHWCFYRRLQGSSRLTGLGMEWVERCRCGRQVVITLLRSESPQKVGSKVIKHWFDRDGKLERMTGDGVEVGTKDPSTDQQSNVVI